jgi:hypothetical protein
MLNLKTKLDMSTNDELKNENANGTKPVLAGRAIEYCICTTNCLGCYHKDRKCKKLSGHAR